MNKQARTIFQKIIIFLVISLLIFVIPKFIFAVEAWHTPALDSGCEGDDEGDLVDENLSTSWAHYVSEEHWVIFDMSETYSISKMRIYDVDGWGNPTDVTAIYVSDNKEAWGDSVGSYVFPNEAGGAWREIDTTDKDGRYIKLVSAIAEMNRWYEFNIYGEVSGAPSNTPPNISTPIIIPSTAYTNNTLNCSFKADDNETTEINGSSRWYLNNTHQSTYDNTTTCTNATTCYSKENVTNTVIKKFDIWICEVYGSDGADNGTLRNSTPITISNTAPITPTLIYPANNSILTVNTTDLKLNVYDIDKDSLTYFYYVNDTFNQTNTTNITSLEFVNGTWNWTVHVDDGIVNTSNSSTFIFTINATTDTPPNISTPIIIPSIAYVGDSLNCSFKADDNETTEINISTIWFKNDIHQTTCDNTTTCTNATMCYSKENVTETLIAGDIWICQGSSTDGELNSTIKNSSSLIITSSSSSSALSIVSNKTTIYNQGYDTEYYSITFGIIICLIGFGLMILKSMRDIGRIMK